MNITTRILMTLFGLVTLAASQAGETPERQSTALRIDTQLKLEPATGSESGFIQKDHSKAGVLLGLGIGQKIFGTRQTHDLALATVQYGWVFSDRVGKHRWFAGNWELLTELFGGGQFHPEGAYVSGGGSLLRYNIVNGTAWVPFFDFGGGATASDIREPDLSSTFQFNLQAGPGLHYFWSKHSAFTVQTRLFHLSNLGIEKPNQGVNAVVVSAGVSWTF